jgi:hypothetical protein
MRRSQMRRKKSGLPPILRIQAQILYGHPSSTFGVASLEMRFDFGPTTLAGVTW